jgi:site-specific DNA recombinase
VPQAVIYCRISDDRTGERAGVQRQEADARALCKRRGWEVAEVVVDNDVSASRYTRKKRPGWARVMELATAGDVDVIAAYHTDRLYRRPSELEDLIDLAEHLLIATVEGEFRLDTSDGRAMARVIAAMSAKEADDKSRRQRRKAVELADAGLPAGGGRVFGYEADQVTIRPAEAALVREAARRVVNGDSLRSIMVDWRERGVETVRGGRWETTTIRRMVTAPRMVAKRTHHGQVHADAAWPPILDVDTWEACCAILDARFASPGPRARSYLLAGLVVCGRCGKRMHAQPSHRKGRNLRRYACIADRGGCGRCGINAERLEPDVVDVFLRRFARKDHLGPPAVAEPESGVREEIAALRVRLKALTDLWAVRELTPREQRREAAGEERLARLQRQLVDEDRRATASDLARSKDPAADFAAYGWDHQRLALVDAIEAVVIAPVERGAGRYDFVGRVKIRWR